MAAACSGTPGTTSTAGRSAPAETTTAPAPAAAASSAPGTSTASTTPAGDFSLDDHVAWLLAGLNGAEVTVADFESRFDEPFRAQVPAEAVIGGLEQLAGEWVMVSDDRAPSGTEAELVLDDSAGTSLAAFLSMEPSPPHRLRGLLLQPAALDDPPTSLEAVTARWSELAPLAGLVVADVTDGECRPVAGDLSERRLAVGSVFKLWVLDALAARIAAGEVAWDAPVVIRDELDSLPSGTTQNEPAGSALSVEELARRMISVSDNTATDHLIDLVGREFIEERLAAAGHREPGVNRPFLTTREVFALKLDRDPATRDRFAAAGEAARRDILAGLDFDFPSLDQMEFDAPVAIDTIEWFGSVGDLCRSLVVLDRRRVAPGLEPLGEILTLNPGVPVDAASWPTVAFKGGSEPGVLAFAWLAERADGRRFVVAAIANDPDAPIDEITAVLLMRTAFELLAAP